MHWTKDISVLFAPLRELSRYGTDDAFRCVMMEGTPELSEVGYDSWNGGTTSYALSINIPAHVYAGIEGTVDELEAQILKKVERQLRGETHDFVTKVLIHPVATAGGNSVASQDSRFWLPGHFRLFISHLSKDKLSAGRLKAALHRHGISSFVAHEDIRPTEEWQGEIEKALFSMDALAAILSPGFRNSHWTDHEVGVALGRGVLVLPIRYGLDPYGLMGKYQGLPGKGKNLGEVTESVFATLVRNQRTRVRLVSCLVEQFLVSGSKDLAVAKLNLLFRAEGIGHEDLDKIREKTSRSEILARDKDVVATVNELLAKHGAEPICAKSESTSPPDEEIAF